MDTICRIIIWGQGYDINFNIVCAVIIMAIVILAAIKKER
jgi:hypothetical protein